MRSRSQMAWFAALAALASPAAAQTEPLIVQVPQISSAAAQRLGEACVAFAAKANTATAVAVVDPAGRLLYFFARQGASASAPKTAEGGIRRFRRDRSSGWRRRRRARRPVADLPLEEGGMAA